MEKHEVVEHIECTALAADDRVVVIKINRPQKANSYNKETLISLEKEIHAAIEDEYIRVIIFTGEGNRSFCAGADLTEFSTKGATEGLNLKSREIFDRLAGSSKITIAAINGAAVGGGLELALACDFRFASPSAVFEFPEVSLGLTPAAGGMRRIQPIIGKGRAKEMVLMGRRLHAQEAFDFGLITYCNDDFFDYSVTQALKILEMNQLALQLAKMNLDSENNSVQTDLESVSQALLYELQKLNK
jgi:enoyl-CoA hydratase/carnithine racemase